MAESDGWRDDGRILFEESLATPELAGKSSFVEREPTFTTIRSVGRPSRDGPQYDERGRPSTVRGPALVR